MAATLLLNADYLPLRVVPTKRAVVLLLREKAEVVHEGEGEFRSASQTMNIPSVIRLKYMVKIPYKASIPISRRAVLARDHGLCQFCFKHADTIDHVIPRSRGGKHEWANLVAACRSCNSKKGDQLLSELGWTLKQRPYAPKDRTFLIFAIAVRDEAWTPYLGISPQAAFA